MEALYRTVQRLVAGAQLVSVFEVLVVFTVSGPQPVDSSTVNEETGAATTHTSLVKVVVPQGFVAVIVTLYTPGLL